MELHEISYDAYTEEDKAAFELLTACGVFAVFVYEKKMYDGKNRFWIDEENYLVRPEYKSGVIYAPESVFRYFDKATVECGKITIGAHTVCFEVGNAEYVIDGSPCTLCGAPYSRFSHTYLPLTQIAEALGLGATLLFEERLCVFGEKNAVARLASEARANPGIAFAGGDVVIGEYDAADFTSEDFTRAKDKWRAFLVSTPEKNDLSDPVLQGKISEINERAKALLKKMHKEADRVILFGDEPPTESHHLSTQYKSIQDLSIAWGTYGGELYHNEDLKNDILDALEWMYENMYGEAEIAGTGWRDINTFNWWNWYVDAPRWLTNAMLIMEEFLTMEQKGNYLKVFEHVVDLWRTG